MKFLVIGYLGSMGQRRTKILKELGHEVIGWDIKGDNVFEASKHSCSAWIICTPPDHHLQYIKLAVEHGVPCFVEASVLLEDIPDSELVHPSATMRFNEDIQTIIPNGDFHYTCKSWLPAWHSEEKDDYYAFKSKVNGCKEMIPFELEWIKWKFGDIEIIYDFRCSLSGKFDDYYTIVLKINENIGIVHIDTCSYECGGGQRYFNGKEIKCTEQMYVKEMKHFIDHLQGKCEYIYSVEEDRKILELLEYVEES